MAARVPVTGYVDPDTHAQLAAVAARYDRTISWLVGRAVERMLADPADDKREDA